MKPDQIKVGGHTFDVTYTEFVKGDALGRANWSECEVVLSDGMKPTIMAETFLHEVVHLIDISRNLDLTEHQVDQIAAGLYAVMVDNPALFGSHFIKMWRNA